MNTINLTPAQQFLLTDAADHHAGKVCEFPAGVSGGARNKMLQALRARNLVHADGEEWFVTNAGFEAIGREAPTVQATAPVPTRRIRKNTKQAAVIEMLRRPEGATIAQICTATGWQAHSVRGALSGTLRKKLGVEIISEKSTNGERAYRIV